MKYIYIYNTYGTCTQINSGYMWSYHRSSLNKENTFSISTKDYILSNTNYVYPYYPIAFFKSMCSSSKNNKRSVE
jgi:hypothetical protein